MKAVLFRTALTIDTNNYFHFAPAPQFFASKFSSEPINQAVPIATWKFKTAK